MIRQFYIQSLFLQSTGKNIMGDNIDIMFFKGGDIIKG